ncbi:MAG: VIT1/CCC1 transporter family protein [Candidatus Helarchaeota archaeon]
MLDEKIKNTILKFQKNEINEHNVYKKLSRRIKDPHNKQILKKISDDELHHYKIFKTYTNKSVRPSKFSIWKYYLITIIFGITFGIKLMEKGEGGAQVTYQKVAKYIPDIETIIKEEEEHERKLIELLDEERLKYVSSMVLGLNDALVELTGALAGFTLTFQDNGIIAIAGLVTGIAAALSMGASEYLSTKTEEGEKNPLKASLYTGSAYILVVFLLMTPYFFILNVYFCLGITICSGIFVILIFTFYLSVAKDLPFKRRFLEMVLISLGIALISFIIGYILRIFLHIEV